MLFGSYMLLLMINKIEFPIIYTNAKKGIALKNIGDKSNDLSILFDLIIKFLGFCREHQ